VQADGKRNKSRSTKVPIGLKEKQAIVAEVNETAQAALSAVMADYRGVSVDAMTRFESSAERLVFRFALFVTHWQKGL
jgi:ribosomal protein L10